MERQGVKSGMEKGEHLEGNLKTTNFDCCSHLKKKTNKYSGKRIRFNGIFQK